MKPTPAEIEKCIPKAQRAATPPVRAKGTPVNTRSESTALPNVANNRMKISSRATGTTIHKRFLAATRFSNCPPHSTQ